MYHARLFEHFVPVGSNPIGPVGSNPGLGSILMML